MMKIYYNKLQKYLYKNQYGSASADVNSGSKLIDVLILLAQNKIVDKLSDINLCRATNNNKQNSIPICLFLLL